MASDGLLETVMERLVTVEAAIHESLHVYPWWRPDVTLPAVYNWLTPAGTERVDSCTIRDVLRLTVTVAVEPTAVMGGGDMLSLAAYIDLTRGALNGLLNQREPLGQSEVRRQGFRTVSDDWGGGVVLLGEFPIEVDLDLSVPPAL